MGQRIAVTLFIEPFFVISSCVPLRIRAMPAKLQRELHTVRTNGRIYTTNSAFALLGAHQRACSTPAVDQRLTLTNELGTLMTSKLSLPFLVLLSLITAAPAQPKVWENAYCQANNTWIGPATDAGAALPKHCVNTAVSSTPSPGTQTLVPVGADLSVLLAQAQCGDVLLLTPGQYGRSPSRRIIATLLTGSGFEATQMAFRATESVLRLVRLGYPRFQDVRHTTTARDLRNQWQQSLLCPGLISLQPLELTTTSSVRASLTRPDTNQPSYGLVTLAGTHHL